MNPKNVIVIEFAQVRLYRKWWIPLLFIAITTIECLRRVNLRLVVQLYIACSNNLRMKCLNYFLCLLYFLLCLLYFLYFNVYCIDKH